jgi:hypothetical protein
MPTAKNSVYAVVFRISLGRGAFVKGAKYEIAAVLKHLFK